MTNYKEVTSGDTTFIKPKNMTKGQTFEGTFLRTLKSDLGYPDTYILATKDGEIGINSSKPLAARMSHVSPGSTVKIVYDGRGEAKAGKQPPHLFKVFVGDPTDAPASPLAKVKKSA